MDLYCWRCGILFCSVPYCAENKVNLSVPSLRADNFSRELMQKVQTLRKSGLTFAPEAGTQRLRDVINKNVREEDLMRAVNVAFSGGKTNVKLYFMNGLPTERDEDIVGIATLAQKIVDLFYAKKRKGRGVTVTVSVSCFVPKPFTPFQWEKQITPTEYLRRAKLLKSHLYSKSIEYNYHEPDLSRLEAVFARGDRRLGAVIEDAVKRGARLDGWDEHFRYDLWLDAFRDCGVDPDFYTVRGFGEEENLCWDHIDVGVSKRFLQLERKRAYAGKITPDTAGLFFHISQQRLCAAEVIIHSLPADRQFLCDLSQGKVLIVAHINVLLLFLRQHCAVVIKQQCHFQCVHTDLQASSTFP